MIFSTEGPGGQRVYAPENDWTLSVWAPPWAGPSTSGPSSLPPFMGSC